MPMKKLFKIALQHKIISAIVILGVIAGGYFTYTSFSKNSQATRYVLAAVEKGTLIVAVSGSGQVAAATQVDIKSQNSGDLIYLGIKDGQTVKKGLFWRE